MQPGRRRYLPELDDLRAVAIAGVVTIHGIIPLLYHGRTTFTYNYGLLLNQLARYCVPLFLLLAAFLVTYHHDFKAPGTFGPFIRRRLLRVAVPYAVWTLFGILERRPHGIGAWLRTIFLGQGYYGQLYFVPLIMQLYLLSPLVYRAIAHRYRRCTVSGLMAAQALLVVLYQLTYLHIVGVPTTVQAALDAYVQPLFPVWIGYWALGMFLGLSYSHFARWVSSLRPAPLAVAWAAAACWVLADVYWSIGITGTPISQATNFFRISVVVFSLVSMLAFFRWTLSDWHGTRRRGPFGKALQLLGQHSFGVYLVHIFVQRRLQAISWTAGLFNTWYGCTLAIALILLLSLGLSVLLSRLRWGWLLVGTSTRGQYERTRPAVGA